MFLSITMRHICCLTSLALLILAGCNEKPPVSTPKATGASEAQSSSTDGECEVVVASVHDTFQLQRLGLTTSVHDGVARINDWRRSCGAGELEPIKLPAAAERLLVSIPQASGLDDPQFSVRDGAHLSESLMFRELAQVIEKQGEPGQSDLDRVLAAFEYVVRNIGLWQHPWNLPLTSYETCLFGKGTPEDRAVIFAGILKQWKIDAVHLAPREGTEGSASDGSAAFLVGVLLDGQVSLFDPKLGLPVPAAGPDASGKAPATLAQATADPQILRRLDADDEHKYPLKAEDLQKPAVGLITEITYWSPRMRNLQTLFSGEQAMVISDPLGDTEGPGLWNRVAAAGGEFWTEADLSVWSYPLVQVSGYLSSTEEQQQHLQTLMFPFSAYFTLSIDSTTGKLIASQEEQYEDPAKGKYDPQVRIVRRLTTGAQMRTRLKQLTGQLADAVSDYTTVWEHSKRVAQAVNDPPTRLMHARAADDASFWIGLCKFQQREYGIAADSLKRYLKQQRQGMWRREARQLLAQSLAGRQNYSDAVKELSEVEEDDPEYLTSQWLIRTWRAASGEQSAAAETPDTK